MKGFVFGASRQCGRGGRTYNKDLQLTDHVPELEDSIRIISAREATPRERKDYEQG